MAETSHPEVEPLLSVRGLSVAYGTPSGPVTAVDGVEFDVAPGEFLGVVGESGCGKSTTLFAVAQLLAPPAEITGGSVQFRGQNLVTMTRRQLNVLRWKEYSVVMQSAMNALNPVTTIAAQFGDALDAHERMSKRAKLARSREVLALVGIDPTHLSSHPHQLSGGMRQRAMIAMALLFTPQLVIMDEPTSALDVVAQRSLMMQIKDLQRQLGFAVVFVTHDMSLVSHYSDRLLVMYAGRVVENGPTRAVFDHPAHPYSKGLLEAFPSIRGPKVPLIGIPGSPPSMSSLPTGCSFQPRCVVAVDDCTTVDPPMFPAGPSTARCLLLDPARHPEGVR